MKICPIAYTVNLTESKGVNKSVESLWERSVNLQVIKSGDSIAQDVVVSDSTFGSILPEIRNLAIACIWSVFPVAVFTNSLKIRFEYHSF